MFNLGSTVLIAKNVEERVQEKFNDTCMSTDEYISLRNSTQHIGGHSVHQWAYLWWSGINFGGPKKYAITKKDIIIISQGNAAWNTTEMTACIKYYTWEPW